MATNVFSAAPNNGASGTGTEIRTWVQAIHNALVAVGMVQTADTGQINPATALNPATTETSAGYEIWRFADALQATHPLVVKVEYGRSTGVGSPAMWLTVGKSSDGSGAIGSVLLTRSFVGTYGGSTATADTTTRDGYASSGDGSMLAVILGANSTATALPAFIIDRSRNSTGAPTGDGVSIAFTANPGTSTLISTGTFTSHYPRTLKAANYATAVEVISFIPVTVPRIINGVFLGNGGSLALSAISPVFPWSVYAAGVIPWQSIAALSWVDDPGGVFTARIAGVDRTYRSVPLSAAHNMWGWSASNAGSASVGVSAFVGLAILWE